MRRERRVRDRSHTRKLGLSLTNNGESLPVPKQEGHDRSEESKGDLRPPLHGGERGAMRGRGGSGREGEGGERVSFLGLLQASTTNRVA